MKKYFLLGNACLLLAGCQTFDKTLDSADRALAVAKTPTAKTVADIARSDNREAAIREGLKRRAELYERDPQVVVRDLRGLKRDYDNLVAVLTGNVNRNWGRKETKLPTRTSYIKYTQNYKSRAIVDFDAGTITVETVDDKDPKTSLKNAIVTTLLTPDDPRAVDLFSDKSVTLSGGKDPYLLGLVQDQQGKSIATPAQAEAFADYLIEGQATSCEYCVISAYNTGPSNVLKAFSKDKVAAVNSINGLEPPGVYEKLRTGLPYEETRQYLVRVVGYRKQFLSFGK